MVTKDWSATPTKQPDYLSYLLRLWRNDGNTWCASLEAPGGSEILSFPSLEALVAFLEIQTGVKVLHRPEEGGESHEQITDT